MIIIIRDIINRQAQTMKPQIIVVKIRLPTEISSSSNNNNNNEYNENNRYNNSNKNKEEGFMGEDEDEDDNVLTIQMLRILIGDGNSLFLYFSINVA